MLEIVGVAGGKPPGISTFRPSLLSGELLLGLLEVEGGICIYDTHVMDTVRPLLPKVYI